MITPETPDQHDPFVVLGVPRDCSPETLHRAYRALARRYHPDVNADAAAVADMRRINAAFVAARRAQRAHAAVTAVPVAATPASPSDAPAPARARPVADTAARPPRFAGLSRQVAWGIKLLARAAARPLWGLGVVAAAAALTSG